jgi:Tfp pilus assembly protein PilV
MKAVTPGHGPRGAFSLIEVVLAVGVVAFAIISVLALFGQSLQSARQVTDEDEALGIARALPAFLQAQGFNTVYGWIQTPASAPTIYGYNISPAAFASTSGSFTAQQAVICTSADTFFTGTTSGYPVRLGRLFEIQLSLSPNMPIHTGTTSTTYVPIVSGTQTLQQWAASTLVWTSTGYPESILPIRASIYPVGGLGAIPAGVYPAFTYDTAVSR